MRPYCGQLAATAHTGVSISELPRETHLVIDDLARQHNVGRSAIATAILDHAVQSPKKVAEIVKVKMGEPRRRGKYIPKVVAKNVLRETKMEVRKQDEVCLSIHGSVPFGGCRYPHCDCK